MTRHRWADLLDEGPAGLLAALTASVQADLRDAADALHRNDARCIGNVAHRLKGSARLAGDERAIALCASLEAAGQSAQLADMKRGRELLEEIGRVFGEALRTRGSP